MTEDNELREDAMVQDDEVREWPPAVDGVDERVGRSDLALVGQAFQSTSAATQGCRPYGHCAKNAQPRWMAIQAPKVLSPPVAMKDKGNLDLNRQQVSWAGKKDVAERPVFESEHEQDLADRGSSTSDTTIFAPRNSQDEDADKFAVLLHGVMSNLQSMTIAVRKMEDWHKRRCRSLELRGADCPEATQSRFSNDSLLSLTSSFESMQLKSTSSHRSISKSNKVETQGGRVLSSPSAEVGRRGSMGNPQQLGGRRPSLNISAMKMQLRQQWDYGEDVGSTQFELEAVHSPSGAGKAKLRRGRTTREIVHNSSRVLHPYSFYRLMWNILCLLAIFYDIFAIPLQGFAAILPDEIRTAMRTIDWILAGMWSIDVLISARTGFYVKAVLNMEPFDVMAHYTKTWMVPDLVLVGISWYAVIMDDTIRFGNVFRVRAFWTLRWLRLGRIWKMNALWRIIEDQINTNLFHLCFGLVKLTTILIIMVHIVTCLWFYLGESQVYGWTKYYESAVDGPRDFFFWYFASSRWTLAQINGRTDINEKRTIQELYYTCAVAILFAVIFMSIFISSITTTMVELSAAAEAETSTRRLMNEYMGYYQVPIVLVGSVKRHLRDMTFQDDQEKEQKLFERLPRQLASDLLYEIHAPVLMSAPFFQELDACCPRVMRHLCFGVITSVSVHKWEIIFDFGDACSRMLVVRKGELMYSNDHSCQDFWCPDYQNPDAPAPPGQGLQQGNFLCEAALWIEWVNHGRLIAAAQSSLICLDAKKFADFVRDYKDAWVLAAAYARSFVDAMKSIDEISDLFAVKMIPPGRNSYESETSIGGTGSQMSKMLGAFGTAWRPSLTSNRTSTKDSARGSHREDGRESNRQSTLDVHSISEEICEDK